jgi:hypothetical protein
VPLFDDERAALRKQLASMERALEDMKRRLGKPLSSDRKKGSVNVGRMLNVRGLAISKGHAKAGGRGDKFLAHIQDVQPHGFTLRSLALAIRVAPATLHAYRRPKGAPNSRPIPAARAARIERLTGWPADAAHWPSGIS